MKNLITIFILTILILSCNKNQKENTMAKGKGKSSETNLPTLLVAPVSQTEPAVTGLVASVVGSQVNLSWDAVPGATTYWVYRGTYVPSIVSATSYSDVGSLGAPLVPGTTYTYRVAAVINSVLRQQSDPVTVTF